MIVPTARRCTSTFSELDFVEKYQSNRKKDTTFEITYF